MTTTTELQTLLENYHPGDHVVSLVKKQPFVLLVGISGAGKDTLKNKLLAIGEYYDFISHTTRQPRMNQGVMEKDGVEYHFITPDTAKEMLRNGDYIEAKVYSGNVYGTSVQELVEAEKQQKIALNDIEVQGVGEYRKISNNVVALFILPPSFAEWQARWKKRYVGEEINTEDMKLRFATAAKELQLALSKGYYQFVINDDLERAVTVSNRLAHGTIDNEEQTRGIATAKELLQGLSTHLA